MLLRVSPNPLSPFLYPTKPDQAIDKLTSLQLNSTQLNSLVSRDSSEPMAEREQTRPLAVATPTRATEEDTLAKLLVERRRRRRRCYQCCGCAATTLVTLVVIIVILVFTVFKVRDPKVRMNSVRVQGLEVGLGNGSGVAGATVNMTLVADVSVKNPNAASFRFGNSTTSLTYGGAVVGEARTGPGNARAHKTVHLNVTVDVIPERIVGVGGLMQDLVAGVLTVNTATGIGGRVKIIGIVKKHIDIRLDCVITVNTGSRSVQDMSCERHVSM